MREQPITIDINTALTQLSKGELSPVYFLMGNDQFIQQLFTEKLADVIFKDKPLDKSILLPDEMSSKDIIESLTSMDLFSTVKLFILRNPTAIRGSYRTELLDYVEHPLENHYLVIISDEWGFRTAFSKALARHLDPITCSTPFESGMKQWARKFFQEQGISQVQPGLLDSIVMVAGDSLSHLKNEIDKIGLVADADHPLTRKDLSNLGNWKREYRQFEFFTALGEKNLARSLKLGLRLVSKVSTMLNLVYPLTDFYRELFFLKSRNGTKSWYSGYTALTPAVKKNLPRYAQNYQPEEITRALRRLWQIDQQIKRSQVDDETAVTDFIFSVLGHG
jgi:DNA polymerase III delta subunit